MRVIDLKEAIAPKADIRIVGIRPGEKLHEVLISEDEARAAVELKDMYVIQPPETEWFGHDWQREGKALAEGFVYASNTNSAWISVEQLKDMLDE
jgi:UDP-N-acetylglucosamine 4,6-dehydratase